jgi:PPE-repeat protein
MDMNIDVDPDWGTPPGESAVSTTASDQGAGNLGFAGTVSKGSAQAAGLATLSDDEFGGGPTMPILSKVRDPETPDEEGERG